MRSFEQRKEEIFARGKARIAQRKKTARRVVMTCVPLVLCVCIAGGWLTLRNGGRKLALDSAPPESALSDQLSYGDVPCDDGIYNGAAVPEDPKWADKPDADVPNDDAAEPAGGTLKLYRKGMVFTYTEQEIVALFTGMLEGTSFGPGSADASADWQKVEYGFAADPSQLITDDQYLVKLTDPQGGEILFTLRGARLTRQDGQTYILTEEQASILHKLLEEEWP